MTACYFLSLTFFSSQLPTKTLMLFLKSAPNKKNFIMLHSNEKRFVYCIHFQFKDTYKSLLETVVLPYFGKSC